MIAYMAPVCQKTSGAPVMVTWVSSSFSFLFVQCKFSRYFLDIGGGIKATTSHPPYFLRGRFSLSPLSLRPWSKSSFVHLDRSLYGHSGANCNRQRDHVITS